MTVQDDSKTPPDQHEAEVTVRPSDPPRSLIARLRPYLPAALTIAVVALAMIVFARPIENWFRGRPVFVGEASGVTTVDAGPLRVGVSVRPARPYPGEAELFVGVGDEAGKLLVNATLTALVGGVPMEVEPAGDGRFRVTLDIPDDGPLALHLDVREPTLGGGHAAVTVESGRVGVGHEGAVDGIAFYTCPMHPSIRTPSMGTCPICAMDLVAVTQEEVTTGAVRIDARRRQLIGVTTEVLAERAMTITVRATGIATWDETKLVDVTARADGWVEVLYADSTGKPVKKGDPLVAIYVPEIRSAELELIAAIRGQREAVGTMLEKSAKELRSAAYEKLRLLGVSDEELRQVLRSGKPEPAITLTSPIDGLVASKMVSRGSPVMANQPMLRLAVLDPVWVLAHIYEQDLALVEVGQEAMVTFPYLEGGPRRGTVTFLEPALDESTRTLRVRIALDNADGAVRPGMYAQAVMTSRREARLTVPHEAVIFAGPRRLVFVDEGAGKLRPVEVTLGVRDDHGWEVRSGLIAGQRVVTSGNFLLGAESRLRSAVGAW